MRALLRLAQLGQTTWQRAAQALAAVDPNVLEALTPWHTFWLMLQAELALGEGRYAAGLQSIQAATTIMTANGHRANLAAAWELQARVLLHLQRPAEALALLDEALQIVTDITYLPLAWRIHATRAQILETLAQRDRAHQEWQIAAAIIQKLAATIDDRGLRKGFLADPLIATVMTQIERGLR